MHIYTTWNLHGEGEDNDSSNESDEVEMIDVEENYDIGGLIEDVFPDDPNIDAKKFYKLVEKADKPLYPGCEKFSNLSFVVKLMHIKCINGWSNKSLNMLLELLTEVFPMCDNLPKSYYEAKKIVKDLGLYYEKLMHVRIIV